MPLISRIPLRCQLEVAQLALPVFILRAETILRQYAAEDTGSSSVAHSNEMIFPTKRGDARSSQDGGAGASSLSSSSYLATSSAVSAWVASATAPSSSSTAAAADPASAADSAAAALTEKARHVVELLRQLRVAPAAMDSAVALMHRPQV